MDDEKDYADYPAVEDEIASLGLTLDLENYLKENPECDANDFWVEHVAEPERAEWEKMQIIRAL